MIMPLSQIEKFNTRYRSQGGRKLKVLLMDDRKAGQALALGEEELKKLESMPHVTLMYGYDYVPGSVCDSEYDLLAFHRKFLMDRGWLEAVVQEAASASKWLILFSGTVSENMLFESGHVLRMNSDDFYSGAVVDFIASLQDREAEEADHLLLKLLYGKNWQLPAECRRRREDWLSSSSDHVSGPEPSVLSSSGGRMMNILVLHNENLPAPFLQSRVIGRAALYVQAPFRPDSESDIENYDSFVHDRLGKIFEGPDMFDAVVMPYSFSKYDCLEYTGMRVAMHIRLTGAWRHEHVPILFLGPEDPWKVGQSCQLGGMLFTEEVYESSASTLDGLYGELQKIDSIHRAMTDDDRDLWYEKFLEKIAVEPPANYDAPHSFSNEWALLRWKEMFDWKDDAPVLDNDVFRGMLYFKLMMAASGRRMHFKKKNKKNPQISGIEGKTFVLIDDSASKGWETMLRAVIEDKSFASLICFDSFHSDDGQVPDTGLLEKDELLAEVDKFLALPQVSQADCYIVDMHLCLEDEDCPPDELTGMEVVRRLKKANRANQVVVFTASDQVWNQKAAFSVMDIAGYVVKEDPADNFSRGESYRMFCDFSNALVKASRLSVLKKYVDLSEKYSGMLGDDADLLDEMVDLMLLDTPEYTMKPLVLNMMVFLENYLKDRYNVCDDGYFYMRRGNKRLSRFDGRVFFKAAIEDGHRNVVDVCFFENAAAVPAGWDEPLKSDIRDVIVPLYFHYGVDENACRMVVSLKKLRNTRVAHGGGDLPIDMKFILTVFDQVIFPMLEKDLS